MNEEHGEKCDHDIKDIKRIKGTLWFIMIADTDKLIHKDALEKVYKWLAVKKKFRAKHLGS